MGGLSDGCHHNWRRRRQLTYWATTPVGPLRITLAVPLCVIKHGFGKATVSEDCRKQARLRRR